MLFDILFKLSIILFIYYLFNVFVENYENIYRDKINYKKTY